MTQNIILTGFMGTGKTTVGKILAQRLGYQFVDTDVMIESRSGRSIPEIFAEQGEVAFRQIERDVARDLAQGEKQVVSTGGGMMLDAANSDALDATGQIFCLTATPEEILARVLGDEKDMKRPLLQTPDPQQRILDLLTERRDIYGQFPQISTSGRTPEAIAQSILNQVQKQNFWQKLRRWFTA